MPSSIGSRVLACMAQLLTLGLPQKSDPLSARAMHKRAQGPVLL